MSALVASSLPGAIVYALAEAGNDPSSGIEILTRNFDTS
jgi:hypothetical protein